MYHRGVLLIRSGLCKLWYSYDDGKKTLGTSITFLDFLFSAAKINKFSGKSPTISWVSVNNWITVSIYFESSIGTSYHLSPGHAPNLICNKNIIFQQYFVDTYRFGMALQKIWHRHTEIKHFSVLQEKFVCSSVLFKNLE